MKCSCEASRGATWQVAFEVVPFVGMFNHDYERFHSDTKHFCNAFWLCYFGNCTEYFDDHFTFASTENYGTNFKEILFFWCVMVAIMSIETNPK